MTVVYGNNLSTTLSSSVNASITQIACTDLSGWPAIPAGDHMWVTLEDGQTLEIVRVSGYQSQNVLTVERAQDGTSAQSFAANSVAEVRVCRALLMDLQSGGTASTHNIWHGGLATDLASFAVSDLTSLTAEDDAPGTHTVVIDGTGLADGWTAYIVTLDPSMLTRVTTAGIQVTTFTDPANQRMLTSGGDTYRAYSSPNLVGGGIFTFDITLS